MPSAVKEMLIDGPQSFGPKAPACLSRAGFFQGPNGSTEMQRNFYCTKKVGHYLIGKTLGEGSFAKVREGLHVMTDEKVAIKVIDKHKVKNDEYVMKNMYREAHIQQMIRHPNITQLLDIMETDNNYYLVMELCVGGNLLNHIFKRRHLEEWEVQKYIRQLIMAVEHLHRAGVVHRDLKIENLLLDENNNLKLIDFGLSNAAGLLGYTDPFSTQCGSPAYAAPELLNRQKYGPKVDVWSIGVNMYAMLTGMLPFSVDPFSLTLLHEKMVNKEFNPLPPGISPGAVMLLRNLLEPDPAKRPAIRQVVANPWLHGGEFPTSLSFLNRIHSKDINHAVVQHMTEKMGYKYSDVLSNVNSNRASSALATYCLLNKKMDRILNAKTEPAEKEKTKDPPQPHRAAVNGSNTAQPPHDSAYLPGMTPRDSVLNPGLLRQAINGRDSVWYPGGTVPSSKPYMEVNPFLPFTPLPDLRILRRLEDHPLLARGPAPGWLDFPTSSRIIGVPTVSPVMGVPTISPLMAVPASSRVMGVPTISPAMGVPTSSHIIGVPTMSPAMGVPTIALAMGVPISSRIIGVPTISPVGGVPTSSCVMGVPTISPAMGVPTSSRVMGVPTISPAMGVPTISPGMGVPTSSRVMGVSTISPGMGVPTSSRVMGFPTSSPAMGFPTSSRVMGVPTISPGMGVPTSSRVMGVPTSSPVTRVPIYSDSMGVATSSRVMGPSWDTSVQEKSTRPQLLPPWLRLANGPPFHLTHPQRNAPVPSALTNLGIHAQLKMAYTDRRQDRFAVTSINQGLNKYNPLPGPGFRPMPFLTQPTYQMQTLPFHL